MPALNFDIEWPDGDVMECYSPSTIVLQYYEAGATMTISELESVSRTAMNRASARVVDRFGFECTAANEQKNKILRKASCFEPDQVVRVLRINVHEQ